VVARLKVKDWGGAPGKTEEGLLYDALGDRHLAATLLEAFSRRRRIRGAGGEVAAVPTAAYRRLRGPLQPFPEPTLLKTEQSNTSVQYGDRLVLKVFRYLEEGVNPELEVGRFLAEKTSFRNVPPLAGAFEFHRDERSGEPVTLGVLHGFIPDAVS